MVQILPSLAAIRAFEAAARHQSFTRAAEELGMSQASVSYQIRVLEERLGFRLFARAARKVHLTRDGERLAKSVVEAFDLMRTAFQTVEADQHATLTISATPTFSANWLAPNIGRFQIAHPEIAVRVFANEERTDFARSEIDLAIRYGDGGFPGLRAHRLMPTEFTPVFGPALGAVPSSPQELLEYPLICPRDSYWRIWFDAAGCDPSGLERLTGTSMASQTEAAQAAMAGHGIAMLSPRFFRQDLASGRLIQPFELVATDGMAHWLVYPEARRNLNKIRLFRRWIEVETAQDPH
ncbi:LysR substrate-binding domain-containing protein [Ruegeria sp. 2205SS24-7]|uniref:LysR substrate-binding domain-containing protein n=1 Tax=Ruegeria discodermiae TaxID=3064389 RepID=UPI00274275E9|nr:LysR substrate-binding domain-containing protein [Ruegeria sp. 2205SS24-7]MDP5216357.1 LysR substrate-binding domain-containing protein [Ruegeria sp. 2205SS24-7]